MSNTPISIILLTRNEQENLKKWQGWISKLTNIDEIIAIDDGSTDDTKKIIKSLESKEIKVKILDRGVNGDFASQRNYATKQASNDWILFLDADETPSPKLISFLNNLKPDNDSVYSFKRYFVYFNRVLYHGPSTPDQPIRLFNKNNGTFIGPVHEVWTSKSKIVKVEQPIFHYTAPTLKIFIEKLNRYSTIRAQGLFNQKIPVTDLDFITYPTGKFIQYYFFYLGFIDGVPGLIICGLFAFYSFLVRSKLWRLYHA